MYISTSYYRVLVQELRVFRPQNAPNSVPCNLAANSDQHAGVGRNSALAGSSHCRGAASKSGGVTHFCKSKHSYGTLLSTADTGITRTNVMKCMYTFISNCMYISTSYYSVLVQELRVFRPSAVLRRVAPEFLLILHGMTRVTQF